MKKVIVYFYPQYVVTMTKMEVYNAHKQRISETYIGTKCIHNKCPKQTTQVLTFNGSPDVKHILGDMVSFSSKNDVYYICSCDEHTGCLDFFGKSISQFGSITETM